MMNKRRILIIDDEAGFTRLLRLNFHHAGKYIAETVNDPAGALAVASAFLPDVILLDVMMPAMQGGEVASRLRAIPKLQDVPIVFLTAAVKRNEIESHNGCIGGLPFLSKPVDFQELVECIEQQCRDRPPREGNRRTAFRLRD
jgi:CheY-like chemotaxis protein